MKRFMPFGGFAAGSLGSRAMAAGSWSLFSTMSTYVLRLGSNLILTRLLMPEAFGMIALAAMLIAALSLFTDIGLQQAIAREPDGETPKFLRVIWVIKVVRGAIIAGCVLLGALLLWLSAPIWAPEGSVYAQPQMPGVIAVTALSPLLIGAGSTAWELTMRRLDYKRFVIFEITAQILGTSAMVAFALIHPSVWALLAGMMLSSVLQLIFSHLFMPGPRMAFEWDAEISARIWHFGKWLMGSSWLTFIGRNADRLILGALLSATSFGIYVIAFIWIDAGRTLLTNMTGRVGFPVIAEAIRTRPQDVQRLYGRYQKVLDAICGVGFLAAFLVGKPVMQFLYTDIYENAGIYVQLMSPVFLYMRYFGQSSLLVNMGNSRSAMTQQLYRAGAICLAVPAGYAMLGVPGAILGVVTSFAAPVPYILVRARETLGPIQSRTDWIWFTGSVILTVAIYAVLVPGGDF